MDRAAAISDGAGRSPKVLMPWVVVFVFGTCIGGLLCWLFLVQPVRDNMQKSMLLKPAGDARITMLLLEQLHAGNAQRVITTLQTQLDGQIVALGVSTGRVDSTVKDPIDPESAAYIEETLRRAAVFLDKHPRTPQTDPAFAINEQALARTLASAERVDGRKNAP